jgi:hypothetical protein
LPIAAGERVRVRAVSTVETADGKIRRLANGTTVIVQSVATDGRLVLADGSRLRTRQIVHGYALTSHAAQGLTVDKVFLAGAMSREGLYVSATRGREAIRIYVPDREAFLAATGLKSEARPSAIEFARQHALGMDLSSVLARGWRHILHVRACFVAHVKTSIKPQSESKETVVKRNVVAPRPSAAKPAPIKIEPEPQVRRHAAFRPRSSQGARMRF